MCFDYLLQNSTTKNILISFKKTIIYSFLFFSYTALAYNNIELISQASDGMQGNNHSTITSSSADGKFIVFSSCSTNLHQLANNGICQVYLRDRLAGITQLVSKSSSGEIANQHSQFSTISGNGRFVAFTTIADNLVENDTNNKEDVFVFDRLTQETSRASISSTGNQGNNNSYSNPSVSFDGRYIAFKSQATNLVQGNNGLDIYIHDRQNGTTERVSVSTSGEQGNGPSHDPKISSDGRFVTFWSFATNLVDGDTNQGVDVFLHDRQESSTILLSKSYLGAASNHNSRFPVISGDGRFIAYESQASNLVSEDNNNTADIFLYDRLTENTQVISNASNVEQGNSFSTKPVINDDGTYIVFSSLSSNFVSDDTNNLWDLFVYSRNTGHINRINTSSTGEQTNNPYPDFEEFYPSINANGSFIAFNSPASNFVQDDLNNKADVFQKTNPLFNINLVGEPNIDRSSESGVFVWRAVDGRTIVKVTAGAQAQRGQITDYEGNIISGSGISVLTPLGLESSDSLNLIGNNRIEFDLLAQRPWEDRFSFIADENQSLCITLDTFEGGLFLGPDKIKVKPPYDINGISDCGSPRIEINGTPDIDRSAETGVFAWVNQNGRTVVKFVAGNPAQGGASTQFSGKILANQSITSLVLRSIESSDTVIQSQSNLIDFDVFAIRPWEDSFSFISTTSHSICITLDDYTGGLFIGPNKVEVSPPFDLATLMPCEDGPQVVTFGSPTINRSADVGIFVWVSDTAPTVGQWVSHVSSGDGSRAINVDVNSDQSLTNVFPINIESSDVFTVMPSSINMVLNVKAPWIDGFRFNEQLNANTCVSTSNNDVPIFLGPNRVYVGSSINLNTQTSCF